MDRDHYTAAHPDEEQIEIEFNFRDDVEEALIAAGVEDDKAA